MSSEIDIKLGGLITTIYKLSGTEFNINSTQQLAAILFDKLKLTKIKQRSTAEPVLEALRKEHSLPNLIQIAFQL